MYRQIRNIVIIVSLLATTLFISTALAAGTGKSSPAIVTVTNTPRLSCPETVIAGQTLAFSGTLFHPGTEVVSATWDGIPLPLTAPAVAPDGTLRGSATVPADSFMLHTLTVADAAGGTAACFPNLIPARPTATPSATPTRTPSPSPTATPGPPPGITVTPTATPAPGQPCAAIAAQYSRAPLAGSTLHAGLAVTNTGADWPAAQLALWQYRNLPETDTGIRVSLPAAAAGQRLTLSAAFPAPAAPGPVWYRWQLVGSPCASDWQALTVQPAVPAPPGRVTPPEGVLLADRAVALAWLPGEAAGEFEVRVLSITDGVLFNETTAATTTVFSATRDYPPASLAWQVRARNAAGWGPWTSAINFGIDTLPPTADLNVGGVSGANGWWRSPLTVRVTGDDVRSAFFQPGDTPWQQVIPGGTNILDREGVFTLRGYTRDAAFNRSPVISRRVALDWTAPANLALHYATPLPASGFFTAPVTVSLRAEDPVSGVLTRSLRADGGAWQTAPLNLQAEGTHTVAYFAADTAGNTSPIGQTVIRLDHTPPQGHLAVSGNLCQTCPPLMVSVAVSDTLSGVARWTLRAANRLLASGTAPAGAATLAGADYPPGNVVLVLTVSDRAGWTATRTLTLSNAAAPVGATPTPWAFPTATSMPTATISATVVAYATATPTVTPTPQPQPVAIPTASPPPQVVIGNYPVATGTAIPVILPVTGSEQLIMNNEQWAVNRVYRRLIHYLHIFIHFLMRLFNAEPLP